MEKIVALNTVQNYTDLNVWKDGIQLVKMIYKLTAVFPREEQYGLVSQMRRAAVSIPSNIAEGHARNSLKEYIQFLSVAVGSLAELRTQLIISAELEYADAKTIAEIQEFSDKHIKMLRSLQKSLKEKL